MFSRRQRTIPQLLDVNTVLRSIEQLLNRVVGTHALRLDLDTSELPVRIDPALLKQVVINLVTNARDAITQEGSITIGTSAVDLAESDDALEPGKYVMLTVTDTGTGMDSETQQLIFDPFFTTKDVDKGTGLGLATVYGIVQQCGGDVRVTSQVNQGSCFRVYLPQSRNTACSGEPDVAAVHASGTPSPNVSAATILLVEDEPIVRKVAKRILSRAGFRVFTAESGEQALRISAERREHIDVLVTDVVMPGMGGGLLAEQMRIARPTIRTLFMSGYSRDQTIPQDDPVRGTMFLAKPFTNESLVTRVKELLTVRVGVHTSAA
jgi:CheY-like chemotaxis protein